MKTDFILTYDKDREPDARILEALVSDIANCKMVVYDKKNPRIFQNLTNRHGFFSEKIVRPTYSSRVNMTNMMGFKLDGKVQKHG